jgi:hypothetical protein
MAAFEAAVKPLNKEAIFRQLQCSEPIFNGVFTEDREKLKNTFDII